MQIKINIYFEYPKVHWADSCCKSIEIQYFVAIPIGLALKARHNLKKHLLKSE